MDDDLNKGIFFRISLNMSHEIYQMLYSVQYSKNICCIIKRTDKY